MGSWRRRSCASSPTASSRRSSPSAGLRAGVDALCVEDVRAGRECRVRGPAPARGRVNRVLRHLRGTHQRRQARPRPACRGNGVDRARHPHQSMCETTASEALGGTGRPHRAGGPARRPRRRTPGRQPAERRHPRRRRDPGPRLAICPFWPALAAWRSTPVTDRALGSTASPRSRRLLRPRTEGRAAVFAGDPTRAFAGRNLVRLCLERRFHDGRPSQPHGLVRRVGEQAEHGEADEKSSGVAVPESEHGRERVPLGRRQPVQQVEHRRAELVESGGTPAPSPIARRSPAPAGSLRTAPGGRRSTPSCPRPPPARRSRATGRLRAGRNPGVDQGPRVPGADDAARSETTGVLLCGGPHRRRSEVPMPSGLTVE